MKFKSTLGEFNKNPLWRFHFMVDDAIAEPLVDKSDRRVVCTLNEKVTWQCSLMPSPSGWYILVNGDTRNQLKIRKGDILDVQLLKDESDYGFDLPEELAELMLQDEEGSRYFHALTPGKQRTLIYLILKVKNPNSRLNKALAIFHHLKEMAGNLDFKILNQTIKAFNNRK